MMADREVRTTPACVIVMLLIGVALTRAQSNSPLRLEKTIPLSDVKGRIDHMAFDVDNQTLIVAALGNNTLEIVDVNSGKIIRTLSGLAEPQGVLYEPEKRRLWVANGKDGSVRIFDTQRFQLLRSLDLEDDADNIRRDPTKRHVLVGYGSGGIAIFDSEGNKIGDLKVDAYPESFQLEKDGPRIFVNLPHSQKIAVIDRTKSAVIATWTTDDAQSNFPMALDEADGRVFIVCRKPAVLLVLDTKSGRDYRQTSDCRSSDDLFYDQKRKRLYASGGEGKLAVYQQQDADHHSEIAQIDTVKGALKSLFVPDLSRPFVAVRQQGESAAAIRVYEATD